jgi:DNA polymerase
VDYQPLTEHVLHIDIETYSSRSLKQCGVFAYAEAPDFQILLIGYALDDEPVTVADWTREESMREHAGALKRMLTDAGIAKVAYNAQFEWVCLNAAGLETPIEQWKCAMAHARYCGISGRLEQVCAALNLPEDKAKLRIGATLVRHHCTPVSRRDKAGFKTRNAPDYGAKWEAFKEYCGRDVEAEREVTRRLARFQPPEWETDLWRTDCRMNARGIEADWNLVETAIQTETKARKDALAEAKRLTGLANPNSRAQLLEWLKQGVPEDEAPDLRKETVAALLRKDATEGTIRRALELRQSLGRTSIAKYKAMVNARCADGRIRGTSQYYGAHTGRYAGRLVQLQNLPRPTMTAEELDGARNALLRKD